VSPTILRELLAIRRAVQNANPRSPGSDANWYGALASWSKQPGAARDPMRLLQLELPERRYHEGIERHEAEVRAHGGLDRCPACGEWQLKSGTALTYGVAGHPGSEYSGYVHCLNCDYKDM
jgi:hypothetical protein